MKNFIFISPNFPTNYFMFCKELKNNGLRVLGIGDAPYDNLSPAQQDSMNEYYRVDSLENYDEVFRAVAYFIFRYGRIDFLESNNEYWLEQDARLRTDFNIPGLKTADMANIKYKSAMKAFYEKAGIPVARWCLPKTEADAKAFIQKVGYPVIVKPDNGVGSVATFKLSNDAELADFVKNYLFGTRYIMEEFITAEINSYDAIVDSTGTPLFETGNVTPMSIMDIVNTGDNSLYYIVNELKEDVRAAGRAALQSFGVKSRFVHFEFFRLTKDQPIGKKGQVVALEVNMRPCGGFTPDMINFSASTDVYKIFADMIAFDTTNLTPGKREFCAFAGRREGKPFALSNNELIEKYSKNLRMVERMPAALAAAMGDDVFIATFPTEKELTAFFADAVGERK